ncbi:hypothetical protein D3C71_1306270 [compost metagenome]
MTYSDLLPSLLFKINQNQLVLEAAFMELTLWVEQRGSGFVYRRRRDSVSMPAALKLLPLQPPSDCPWRLAASRPR